MHFVYCTLRAIIYSCRYLPQTLELIMEFKIYDLKHVPEEVKLRLKLLLKSKRIRFYEKSKGRHSNTALWVKNKTQSIKAQKVINIFEEEWRENARNNKISSRPPKDIRFKIILFVITLILSFFVFSLFL